MARRGVAPCAQGSKHPVGAAAGRPYAPYPQKAKNAARSLSERAAFLPLYICSFFSSRMSSPKKWSTWYSPSRREAIWGEYRRATSSMVRLEEIT